MKERCRADVGVWKASIGNEPRPSATCTADHIPKPTENGYVKVITEVCCKSNEKRLDLVGRRSPGYLARYALEIRCRPGDGPLNSLRTAGLPNLAFLTTFAVHLRRGFDAL